MIRMISVKSSSIAAVGHDPQAKELHLRFRNGTTHVYAGVSAEKHRGLLAAPSAGKYFIDHIRDFHRARKV